MFEKEVIFLMKYDLKVVEENCYQYWLDGKFFEVINDFEKELYIIVILFLNVMGKLYLGYVWDIML